MAQAKKAAALSEERNEPICFDNPSPTFLEILNGIYPDEAKRAFKILENASEIYEFKPGIWHIVRGSYSDDA